MIDDFIERKQGRRKIEYELPELKEILEETLGVFVYQEQVMQAANKLAGYSLGEADLLRRAMGKKKPEEMAAAARALSSKARRSANFRRRRSRRFSTSWRSLRDTDSISRIPPLTRCWPITRRI